MNQVSLVEQLKEVLKAQNESLRQKHNELKSLREENFRLAGQVAELEIENEGLKRLLAKFQGNPDNSVDEKSQQNSETPRPSSLSISSPNTTQSELYATALTSPESPSKTSPKTDNITGISITLSSTPNSTSKPRLQESPKKATLSRSESRKKKRSSFYELSPDISDKHVQMLEKNYGGKEKAHRAASVIQQHYRNWALKKTYFRLRTQSEARRTSVKGRVGKRGSLRSPLLSSSSSDSMSPTGVPIPLNLNISECDSQLKSPEIETRQRRNSSKEEFKAIQADIAIDSNFQLVDVADTGQLDLSVRRVSEDISSIEISKNLLNDSIGKKMVIDVFQQILAPRKDSIHLPGRSDSFRSKKGEKNPVVSETVAVPETVAHLEGVPEDTKTDVVDGQSRIEGTDSVINVQGVGLEVKNGVDNLHGAEQDRAEQVGEISGLEGTKLADADIKTNLEKEQVVMMVDERPLPDGTVIAANNLSVNVEKDKLRDSCDSFDIDENHSYSWPTLDMLHGDDTTSLGGNSLSPSSSIMQTFYEDKEKDVRIGINHFNRKPKKGINYLIDTGVLHDDNTEGICKFLREEPGINKQKIGEFLGDLRSELSMDVLQLFVRTIPMEGKEVDEALRLFQTYFRMPGEAQKIERLVEEFSTAYVDANPGKVSDNPDTILVLAFAIIMLNTDLHSPNVKRKMSKEQFCRNLRGTNDGDDLPPELLSAIFDRIEKKPFRTGPDNLDAIYKYEKQILGKVPWTTLALPHRQLRQVTTLYEIQHGGKRKEKPHHRVVFLFNDMLVVTKERGQAGQKGIHYYSYKNSYQLCDIKFQLFNNNYYKYGIRIASKVSEEVHIVFHAKKEDIRKAFYTELRDCIEETNVMENERITDCETSRKYSMMSLNKREFEDSMSMTLPRPHSKGKKKPAPDSVSLLNEPGILSQAAHLKHNPLSSSLQDLHEAESGFFSEDGLQKSTSMASFQFSGSESTSISSGFGSNGSLQNLQKRFQLFGSKRVKNPTQRKLTKSTGSLEDIKTMRGVRRKTSTSSDQRKSEFFVTSPIAT